MSSSSGADNDALSALQAKLEEAEQAVQAFENLNRSAGEQQKRALERIEGCRKDIKKIKRQLKQEEKTLKKNGKVNGGKSDKEDNALNLIRKQKVKSTPWGA